MVSIIIPVLNEEKSIEKTLMQIEKLQGEKEVIVVDGGSQDKTCDIASRYAKVVKSEKGRGLQMNSGAAVAKGNILWFVHSDSILAIDSILEMEQAVSHGFIGGGFSLYFYDYTTFFMRYIAKTSNWRAKYLGLYFGDQGLFVRKDIFSKIGGFENIDIMEDWAFSSELKKYGQTLLLDKIGTSGRRFKQGGPLKTHLLMHKIKLLYILGISPSKLAKIYREVR